MKLYIDTSNNQFVSVAIDLNGKKVMKTAVPDRRTQDVLPFIVELIESQKKTLQDITEIEVHTGPGSFTGLRVGVSIANTLGMVLKVPINGQKIGELVKPQYS